MLQLIQSRKLRAHLKTNPNLNLEAFGALTLVRIVASPLILEIASSYMKSKENVQPWLYLPLGEDIQL